MLGVYGSSLIFRPSSKYLGVKFGLLGKPAGMMAMGQSEPPHPWSSAVTLIPFPNESCTECRVPVFGVHGMAGISGSGALNSKP